MNYLLSSPTIQYCETAITGLIARPWYTLSNLSFLAVGILILLRGGRYSRIFGGLALLVGVLSSMYDISYTYLSQLIDLSGMLVLIAILLYLNVRQFVPNRRALISGLIVSFVVALSVIVTFRGFAGDVVFGLLVTSYVISELYLLRIKRHTKTWRWIFAFGIFVLGFIFWICDASHFYCANIGLFNGRAIFHYTSAATIYLLFLFYELQSVNKNTMTKS